MTDTADGRGKRRASTRLEWFWMLLTAAVVAAVIFGGLSAGERDDLLSLHRAVSIAIATLIVGLRGLDAAGAQIIPALKGKDTPP